MKLFKNYFFLQFTLYNRKINDFGLKPFLGYFILIMLYIAFVNILFTKTSYSPIILMVLGFIPITKLALKERNEFLKNLFSKKDYYQIRITENLLAALPTLLALSYFNQYLYSLVFFFLSVVAVFTYSPTTLQVVLPTPFFRYPFEFIRGFRNSFMLLIFNYLLLLIAISVLNFNLSVFTIFIFYFIIISFYQNPENEYFVWIYHLSSSAFIKHKLKIAIGLSLMLTLPAVFILTYFFFNKLGIILLIQLACIFGLSTFILAKYASFPSEINLPELMIISLCIMFPPFLLLIVPYFYNKAQANLQQYLP